MDILSRLFKNENSKAISGSASPEMAEASFWKGDDTVILSKEEIKSYNASLREMEGLMLFDLLSFPLEIDAEVIREQIASYTYLKQDLFFEGRPVTQEDKEYLHSLRNLEAIMQEKSLKGKVAIVTTPADLRAFPTYAIASEDEITEGPKCFDDIQQTQLTIGECVILYHLSADKEWGFVVAKNYFGWTKLSNLAFCDYDTWKNYQENENFAVTLERKKVVVAGQEMNLSMGTRLCLDDCGQVLIPVRGADGSLSFVSDSPKVAMHIGYLPYTSANVLKLAFRLLGDPYSWGGKYGYYDCSATVLAVYSCFGICLPRNTSSMRKITRFSLPIPCDFREVQIGSLMLIKGHVMIALGCVDGEPYVLHDYARKYDENGERVDVFRTEVMSLHDTFRKSGETFKGDIVNIIEIK